jgi:hypothetical protein
MNQSSSSSGEDSVGVLIIRFRDSGNNIDKLFSIKLQSSSVSTCLVCSSASDLRLAHHLHNLIAKSQREKDLDELIINEASLET